MAWPFKKRKGVVDLTFLAKRGLIKPEEFEELSSSSPASSSSQSNDFGFLSSLASSAGSSNNNASSSDGVSKNKVEDIEFKLDSLMRRLNGMIDRVDLAEKKIDRLERKDV